MKDKKQSRPDAEILSGSQQITEVPREEKQTVVDIMQIVLFSVLLFVSMTLQTSRMSMFLCVLAILCALPIGKRTFSRLQKRFTIPVLGLLGFALVQGCAAIYSPFGSYAVTEFYKLIAAFSLVIILLTRFEKKHIQGLLWGFAAVCAVIAILCIDMHTSHRIFDLFHEGLQSLGGAIDLSEEFRATRIDGIYGDANVSASILAVGALLSLYLVISSHTRVQRFLACLLVGINGQVFFLSMSRGAILCVVAAALVWIALAGNEHRIALFCLMVFSAVSVGGLSLLIMPQTGIESFFADGMTILTGVILFVTYEWIGRWIAAHLAGHGKAVAVFVVLIVLGCGAYAVAATQVTGPYHFTGEEYIYRNFSVEPGTYTISGDWDGNPEIDVISIERHGSGYMDATETKVYTGPIQEASFTIEPGQTEQSIIFYGESGTSIREVRLSDGTEIPMGYPLIPQFLVARMQDRLLTSSSFTLRAQYDRDAWKLFKQSPLLGHGLGSTEGLFTSVQPFFYQSKYAHNHLLQVMSDTGVIGLIPFLAILVGSLWILIRRIRKEQDFRVAALIACWLMMNTHSLMEINFSVRAYLCLALCVLMLPVLLDDQPLSPKTAKVGGIAVILCTEVYLAVFGGLLMSKRMIDREIEEFSTSSTTEYMAMLEKCVRRDVFDHEQMQLNYVAANATANVARYNGNMARYRDALRESGTYSACSGLARYYYLPRGEYEELFACSREGIAQEASVSDAWNLQFDFYFTEVLPEMGVENMEQFLQGVQGTIDFLEEYNRDRQDQIVLTEENHESVNRILEGLSAGVPLDGLYILLMQR